MEFEEVAKSPWVKVRLVGNWEYEDYLLGAIDRRSYIRRMKDIARQYAAVHLGWSNTQGSNITGSWRLVVSPDHGVGFYLTLTPLDTPTRRESMEPKDFFLPADYAFMAESKRTELDAEKSSAQ